MDLNESEEDEDENYGKRAMVMIDQLEELGQDGLIISELISSRDSATNIKSSRTSNQTWA